MRKSLLIRVEPGDYDVLKILAKEQDRSMASLARVVLHDYLAEQMALRENPEASRDWQAKVYGGKR